MFLVRWCVCVCVCLCVCVCFYNLILKHKEEFATEVHQHFINYYKISVTSSVALYILLVWNVRTPLIGVQM